jgi:Na+/alanine symporter
MMSNCEDRMWILCMTGPTVAPVTSSLAAEAARNDDCGRWWGGSALLMERFIRSDLYPKSSNPQESN